jgi:hypothetical protein
VAGAGLVGERSPRIDLDDVFARQGAILVKLALEVVRDQLARVPDMGDHRAAGVLGVPVLNRREDRVVLVDVLLEEARASAQRRPGQPARERAVELADDPGEALVPGSVLDDAMEDVIRARPLPVRVICAAVVDAARDEPLDRVAKEPLRRVQFVKLVVLDSGRRKLRGEPLELRPHLVCLADLAGGRPAHDRAPIRLHLDDSPRLQLA